MLTVDEYECVVQYLVCVYLTTPSAERAEAIGRALDLMDGVGSVWFPIEEMERTASVPLPELEAFLPAWLDSLRARPPTAAPGERNRGQWIREAALRAQGPAGLERVARESGKPEDLDAWGRELAARKEWPAVLDACGVALELVGDSHRRGDFLDRAALAARELGLSDALDYLERAWRRAPSLARLLRWLGAGPSPAAVRLRAGTALRSCPERARRQLGLLHLVRGDPRAAAELLADAPGLGWSGDEHPGPLLFGAFTGLLAGDRMSRRAAEFTSALDGERGLRFEGLDSEDDPEKPRLATPSVGEVLRLAGPATAGSAADRRALFEAMRVAAGRRVEGVLGGKRRRHYGHAAALVAVCVEVAGAVGEEDSAAEWVRELRREYGRFSAFRSELDAAL